ncbi:hypothetical protein SAY86_014530 [Trapa natans]|uniref:HTH OST-type domain-containing protein n=1 Tax=Trapa natans TaxID=22666 RepID=A0AAN7KTG2_TRANT|nr:hypothetical protein SAY86_014530 [Trapa natans]
MKPCCSRTLVYLLAPRNPNRQHHPSLFLQVVNFSVQSSNFHSQPLLSYTSRRHEDESRNVRVSVWWDFENCHIPIGVNVFRVAQTITAAVRANGMKGPVQITAFGDVLQLSRANQEALSCTGINLTHIPNGGKNSADRSLLVDLLYWVSRNPPPAHLFLISGDRDFAGILHKLRMNNYNILLASPENVPGVLCSAASIMWHWSSMISGEDLVGKIYNQPPDGPHGSWYGHYNAPLDDPFAVSEKLPHMKNEDPPILESNTEIKARNNPKDLIVVIQNILKQNPEGIFITELREELQKRNVTLDKDFYGYKKFSRFLISMPHIAKVKYRNDGKCLIRPVTTKHTEPSDSIGVLPPSESMENTALDQKITPNLKIQIEERSSSRDEKTKPGLKIVADGSSEKAKLHSFSCENRGKLSRDFQGPSLLPNKVSEGLDSQSCKDDSSSVVQQDSDLLVGFLRRVAEDEKSKPGLGIVAEESSEKAKLHNVSGENWGKLSRDVEEPSLLPNNVSGGLDTQSDKDTLSSVVQQDSETQVGFLRRVWRRWFDDRDSEDLKRTCEVTDHSADSAERKGKEEVVRTVKQTADLVNSGSSSSLKELNIKEEVRKDFKRGFFHRIMSWWELRDVTNRPEQVIEQSNEGPVDKKSEELAKDSIFLQESFWSDVRSFLNSSQGSNVVSESKTRGTLAKYMRRGGPAVLGRLTDAELLHLVDMLISEKKLLEENTSHMFPFRLSQPLSHGSKGLRSIFNKPSKQDGEKKVPNISHAGISSRVLIKKPSDRSRSQILTDVQSLVQEVLVQFPDGYNVACFKKLFLAKYDYPLDLKKLGYVKMTDLLQVIPGLSLESGRMVPSSRVQQTQSSKTVIKAQFLPSSDVESSDSWDELGPLTKESSGGLTKPLECEAMLLDEEEVSSGSEDDSAGQGERQKNPKTADEDSSLIQILESWYSKEPGRGNMNALNRDTADIPQLSNSPFEQSERRHRQQKVYSFVADANGGEREKQIEGILGSLNKRTSEQSVQQQT